MLRLSELVSALTPSTYAQMALTIFATVFFAVLWRNRRHTPLHDQLAAMPLADDGKE
ncbi:MAG: hypothetical protein KBG15_15355 [Kofleriaceae bacterium]|nr:hypothetical protein [Kofleriaceae bacterium]